MVFLGMIFICYLTLLLLPLGLAFAVARLDNSPIAIQQSYIKNPRYFAMSFQQKFEQAWQNYDGTGVLRLSREEQVIEADKTTIAPLETCEAIVYAADQDFLPAEGVYFEKEIYAKKNAYFENIPVVRAVACKGHLIIGSDTRIIRWADAHGICIVYSHCNLGVSTTSGTRLVIGENCFFKRLYAPEIRLGVRDVAMELDSHLTTVSKAIVAPGIVYNLRYVDNEIVDRAGVLRSSIITQHDLTVLNGLEVQGSIRSSGVVKLNDNAIVHGNIFAERDIYIGPNARIYGVVFSQESIFIDNGVAIGTPGKTKSVVARGDITFGNACRVYGYISTEGTGSICPEIQSRR